MQFLSIETQRPEQRAIRIRFLRFVVPQIKARQLTGLPMSPFESRTSLRSTERER